MISTHPVPDTVALNDAKDRIEIIDQTLLPGRTEILFLETAEEIYDAIKRLRVRGAPAIGVTAAFALYLLMKKSGAADHAGFAEELDRQAAYLNASRPTAVNLSWALQRMKRCAQTALEAETPTGKAKNNTDGFSRLRTHVLEAMLREATAIRDEDINACRSIGEYGLSLIHDGDGILTHCNAGRLATVRYGTATAPIYRGHEKGLHLHVYCDETRPLLQGARLTALELSEAGIETTLLCDNMSSALMKAGKIREIFVGCDRVAANGDTANKIGTSAVAILAKHYHIPFYVCAPLTTLDPGTPDGSKIVIEERDATEVTDLWYKNRMAPDNEHFTVYNPAFDVTDHKLITAIVTPVGILRAPYEESISAALSRH
ncbi:MAG: S-methyl-5-thioribose-1-phosphate isomerase [Lachnospiraceae bacterium]|nr:S-methyl-5-thioribose-1-phosphate isomerase [Lachnospiraceae bacterium]